MSTATETREPEVGKLGVVERPPQVPPPARDVLEAQFFSDVLLETSEVQRHRRTWSAILSFVVQCLLLGVLLIVPLLFTDALPQQQLLTFLMAPPPPPPPPPAASVAAAKVVHVAESELLNGRLRAPSKIPQNIQMIKEEEAPPDLAGGGVPGGVPGGIPGGQLGGVIGGILSSNSNAATVPRLVAPVPTKRIRVSQGVTEGRLIQKIEPLYPPLAKAARVQGQVLLNAVISKTGEIQNLVLVSGHPLLVPAALEAVKKWRYRPYLLNGEPVEVETTVTVNFVLNY